VGPGGEEIYTDEHGRVKVQFHWDRNGKKDENSSCWIRVSQPWAGKNWGAVAIPRIGQEVIVDFLEGDPDRPIITGRVYNAKQIPPYALPGNKTQTGIKSRSSMGGDGATFNEIRMEDKKGEEVLYLHAEKDKQVVVENDRFENVGHDESVKIGNDRAETVGNNEGISVGSNQTLSVGEDRSVSVGANMSLSVSRNNTNDVGSDDTESIGKNKTTSVGKNHSLTIGDNYTVKVGKNHTEDVGKAFALKVKDGILIDSKKEIVIKSGSASITLKKNGDIEIKGKKISVKGSGDVVIKGSKITEN
jgi:type VI secretion system secreted protein VgrG